MKLPFDIFTEIIKHINSIKDLHNFCKIGPYVNIYCKAHKKNIFKNLMKKDNFKNDFFNIFKDAIKEDTVTPKESLDKMKWHNIKKLLKYYPIGEFSDNHLINNLQIDFLNIFYNLSNSDILQNQFILKDIFQILFFDSLLINDYVLSDSHILFNIDKFINTLEYEKNYNEKKYHNKIIYVYIYHLHNLKKSNDSLFKEILHDLLKSMFEDILDEWHVQFMIKNISILKKEFNLPNEYLDNIFNNLLQF